jgi:hypothetical protein
LFLQSLNYSKEQKQNMVNLLPYYEMLVGCPLKKFHGTVF